MKLKIGTLLVASTLLDLTPSTVFMSSLHDFSLFHHHCRVVDAAERHHVLDSRHSSASNEETP
jgi:hypothetical protein